MDPRQLAEDLIESHGRGGTAFGVYILTSDEPGAELARFVEREVFLEFFGNTEEMLAAEYGPYEATSVFICVVDHLQRTPAGVIRLIMPSPLGLKSLHDLERQWRQPADDVLARSGLDVDHASFWDIATLAVRADYRGAASGGIVSLALFQALAMLGTGLDVGWGIAILDVVVLELLQTEFHRPFRFLDDIAPMRYLDSPSSLPVVLDVADYQSRVRFRAPALAELLFTGQGLELAVSTPQWDVELRQLDEVEIA